MIWKNVLNIPRWLPLNELPLVALLTQIPIQTPKYKLLVHSNRVNTKKRSAIPKLKSSIPMTMCAIERHLMAFGFLAMIQSKVKPSDVLMDLMVSKATGQLNVRYVTQCAFYLL